MDNKMYHYATVTKALEELNNKGYTVDFNVQESKIINNPNDFEIPHIYRYEGDSDPGAEATAFGIESKTGEKGVFVAGLNAYTENSAAMILHDLSTKGKDD